MCRLFQVEGMLGPQVTFTLQSWFYHLAIRRYNSIKILYQWKLELSIGSKKRFQKKSYIWCLNFSGFGLLSYLAFILLSQIKGDWSILSFSFVVLQVWSETLLTMGGGLWYTKGDLIGENHLSNTQVYIWFSGLLVNKGCGRYQRAIGQLELGLRQWGEHW